MPRIGTKLLATSASRTSCTKSATIATTTIVTSTTAVSVTPLMASRIFAVCATRDRIPPVRRPSKNPRGTRSPGGAQDGGKRDEIALPSARINGQFARPGVTPVEYMHRDISKPALVALYRRADVMMVTALRDGMNLVAQEFVLCQSEPGLSSRWRGALLLSELAGSAQAPPGALLVNPWNGDGFVASPVTALEPPARRRPRGPAPR